MSLPAPDIWTNYATWAVATKDLPWIGFQMRQLLPPEKWDPDFRGQDLETTYFDTPKLDLRKQRIRADEYLTLRVRCYPADKYAISAKTEEQKFRGVIDAGLAETLLAGGITPPKARELLPPDLADRFAGYLKDAGWPAAIPAVTVLCRRFAVQNSRDRLTLDCSVITDTGKSYFSNVLEYKAVREDTFPLFTAGLRPLRLSKFLWATSPEQK